MIFRRSGANSSTRSVMASAAEFGHWPALRPESGGVGDIIARFGQLHEHTEPYGALCQPL